MNVINGLENIQNMRSSVLTMGTFDGLHVGHAKIMDQVTDISEKQNIDSVLLTFEPHPQLILKNKTKEVKLLSTLDEKLELLKNFNLNKVIIATFDSKLSQIDYQSFVKEFLIDRIKMKHLVIGYDHHFGKNRQGNNNSIKELSDTLGFILTKVDPLYQNEQLISSSLIRDLILNGEMQEASIYLGRLYSISGKVVHGDGRGKDLSFPTANIEVNSEHKIIPKQGVYAVNVHVHQQQFKGMMNIGERPTFAADKALEVNLFGLQTDIYGAEITVEFKKRLRSEIKFSTTNELINQLKMDKEESLKY